MTGNVSVVPLEIDSPIGIDIDRENNCLYVCSEDSGIIYKVHLSNYSSEILLEPSEG